MPCHHRVFRCATPRNRITGVIGVAAKEVVAPTEREIGRLGVQKELERND